MSKQPVESWKLVCDWPGCGALAEYGEYIIFGDDGWDPDEIAYENDWRADADGIRHYCDAHPATCASDHEDGEPYPDPPYLLLTERAGVTLCTEETAS